MNGILQMELKPEANEEIEQENIDPHIDSSNNENLDIIQKKSQSPTNEDDSKKNEDQISQILEVILGDYFPPDFRPSTVLTKDSTEKAAIILEELLEERK